MAEPANHLNPPLWTFNPKRSLIAGAVWLIIGLVLAFSIVAAVSVGSIARETVFEQHVRRLRLETDQLSTELGLSLASRIDAVGAVMSLLHPSHNDSATVDLGALFATLTRTYPQLDWLAVSDTEGRLVATGGALQKGTSVRAAPWFIAAAQAPWLGLIGAAPESTASSVVTALGDLALPIHDSDGRWVGVIVTRASWPRATPHFRRLTDETDPQLETTAVVLDRDGRVLVGPASMRGNPWQGVVVTDGRNAGTDIPQFERMPDGQQLLVSRAPLGGDAAVTSLGWQVQLDEPNAHVYQRADAVGFRILWISLGLGAVTAALGVLAARRLTGRLGRLTASVEQVGQNASGHLDVPDGVDEVARLGAAFAGILGALQEERRELERRVAIRTREVERLAEESRYAAIVRERLAIARDLHDTLAHSMMAMLSEIRLLRRLQARDPAALAEELRHAEEVAHEGLSEARKAIAQVRSSTVRETGLGPALAGVLQHFIDRTGLSGEIVADPAAARFGDERGEIMLRMATEVLRNIERHAQATHVRIRLGIAGDTHLMLEISDNGIGFDPARIPPGHYGVVGLREQAELIGARLTVESQPDSGTTVVLVVPLSPVAFGANA